MLTLNQLHEIAYTELQDLLPNVENADFRLEQAEYDPNLEEWTVIVSFLLEDKNISISPLANISASRYKYERVYKKLKINSIGKVSGFYIYKP